MIARRSVFFLLLVLLFVQLCACSPRFDWRDARGEGGYVATFPGKTQSATRNVDLNGANVSMTMQAARVDEISFAVAWVDLPDGAVDGTSAISALRTALLRNIDGRASAATTSTLARGPDGAARLPAIGLDAEGQAGGQPVAVAARFATRDRRVFQLLVLGPKKDLASAAGREAIDTFFASVRID